MEEAQDHSARERADRLRGFHQHGMLVLPNAWDAASAAALVDAGFRAVATASNAISASLGYPDGEVAPWEELFFIARRVAATVDVPVTVDAEAGYGMEPHELVERLLATGAVGCNLEDSDHRSGGLRDVDGHAAWLADVRRAADASGVPLVLNARVDTFLPSSGVPDGGQIDDAVRRANAYLEAGADCAYPIGVGRRSDLEALAASIQGPINGNASEELPLPVLRDLGIRRVSYGPQLHRKAIAGFAATIRELVTADRD